VRRMQVLCSSPEGALLLAADYQRLGARYFTGTQISTDGTATISMTFASKWTCESTPHLPHFPPPTDLDGKRALGPLAVAAIDGFRVVAMAEGHQVIAWVAYKMLTGQSPRMLKEYGPNPLNQFEQVYLHWSVANEAMNMMLGVQDPWKTQLAAEGLHNLTPSTVRLSISSWGNPYVESSGVLAPDSNKLEDARQRILWDAYFSRAKSPAEKQDLLRQVQNKYKVTLVDPDFFSATKSP
jgi:hypothetical protein